MVVVGSSFTISERRMGISTAEEERKDRKKEKERKDYTEEKFLLFWTEEFMKMEKTQ